MATIHRPDNMLANAMHARIVSVFSKWLQVLGDPERLSPRTTACLQRAMLLLFTAPQRSCVQALCVIEEVIEALRMLRAGDNRAARVALARFRGGRAQKPALLLMLTCKRLPLPNVMLPDAPPHQTQRKSSLLAQLSLAQLLVKHTRDNDGFGGNFDPSALGNHDDVPLCPSQETVVRGSPDGVTNEDLANWLETEFDYSHLDGSRGNQDLTGPLAPLPRDTSTAGPDSIGPPSNGDAWDMTAPIAAMSNFADHVGTGI